jgi:hypothetical protein
MNALLIHYLKSGAPWIDLRDLPLSAQAREQVSRLMAHPWRDADGPAIPLFVADLECALEKVEFVHESDRQAMRTAYATLLCAVRTLAGVRVSTDARLVGPHPQPPAPVSPDPDVMIVERYDGTWTVIRRQTGIAALKVEAATAAPAQQYPLPLHTACKDGS